MGLPNINIKFTNGALGQVAPSPDGCFGVVAQIKPTVKFFTNNSYVVRSMDDVHALEINDSVGGGNYALYKFFKEFFAEAGSGTELWVYGVPKDTAENVKKIFESDPVAPVSAEKTRRQFLSVANGKIRGLFVLWNPSTWSNNFTDGFKGVQETVALAQTFLEDYTNTKKAPMFAVLDGFYFSGSAVDLVDFRNGGSQNRVSILIGNTEKNSAPTFQNGSALGVLAGRLAKSPVHVNVGKVADGPLKPSEFFINSTPVKSANVEMIHDKGYITFTNHVGKNGYFFSDDPLCTDATDDYAQLTHRRVIDKAYRIAYNVLLNFVLDDVPLLPNGSVSPVYAKTIEGQVEQSIYTQMSANGELSVDESDAQDRGVKCEVDLTNNVAATSKLNVTVQVRPKGHARYIDVGLGFVSIEN